MEYINGKDYLTSNYNPKSKDIKDIAKQATIINSIKYKVSNISDSWVIFNIIKKYNKIKK
jgi:hypothetical protein